MYFICLLSSRHQGKTGVQEYAKLEYDSDQTCLVTVSKSTLKDFIVRKWMTIICILLNTVSTLWKGGKVLVTS